MSNEIIVTTTPNPPPALQITSPLNITYGPNPIFIEWEANLPLLWVAYSLDGAPLHNITQGYPLGILSEGLHQLLLCAEDSQKNLVNASVSFTISDDDSPPVINHASPGRANDGSAITLLAFIMDDKGIAEASVYYRLVGQNEFIQLNMSKCPDCLDLYNASFKAPEGIDTVVEYYVCASDGTYRVTSPYDAPTHLHTIAINARPSSLMVLPALDITSDGALLTWRNSSAPDFSMYSVYLSLNSSLGDIIANITEAKTSQYRVSGLMPNTTYYYSVRVYDSGGLFADSVPQSFTTLASNMPASNLSLIEGLAKWLALYGVYAVLCTILVAGVIIAVAFISRK